MWSIVWSCAMRCLSYFVAIVTVRLALPPCVNTSGVVADGAIPAGTATFT